MEKIIILRAIQPKSPTSMMDGGPTDNLVLNACRVFDPRRGGSERTRWTLHLPPNNDLTLSHACAANDALPSPSRRAINGVANLGKCWQSMETERRTTVGSTSWACCNNEFDSDSGPSSAWKAVGSRCRAAASDWPGQTKHSLATQVKLPVENPVQKDADGSPIAMPSTRGRPLSAWARGESRAGGELTGVRLVGEILPARVGAKTRAASCKWMGLCGLSSEEDAPHAAPPWGSQCELARWSVRPHTWPLFMMTLQAWISFGLFAHDGLHWPLFHAMQTRLFLDDT